ncbi:MAG: peptidyl-prolyl cis-trans isomerase [Terriglobia bacterium]
MFDLFRSRDKVVRLMLTGMLCLVALSMVTYLIPGSGGGFGSGNSADQTIVASIGKEEVTSRDVSRAVQNMTRSRQMPPELLSIYVPQIVKQIIDERTMAYEANRLGLRVTPEETDSAIIDTLPPELVKNGKVDGATLSALLQQQGMTMADLKASTARQLLVSRLEQIVAQGVVVSPRDIETEFRKRNDKAKIQYALLAPAKYQSEAEPSEAEIKAYYEAHKADFKVAEKKSYAIITLDPQAIGARIQPTDAQLQADYNSRRNDFQTPERVKARHILLKIDAANTDAVVKPKAEALLKQVQAGGDFAKIAKENSQDTGSAVQGGELGFLVKGQTVPEFEKAAFALQPGQISGLVKSQFGYHIIQSEAHEQARLQPFDEVKPQLIADYQKRQASREMQSITDKVLAELKKDPLHPEKAAELANTTVTRAENVQAGDPIPGIGTSKEFDDGTAALRKGEVTPGPIVLQNGRAVLAVVTDVQPAHAASLEEAKADVKNKASQEKLNKLLDQKSNDLIAKAKTMDNDLEKAGKALNIEIKTSPDVDRQGSIESVGSTSSVPEIFTKPVGSLIGPVQVSGGRLIARIVSRTPANIAEMAAQANSIRDEIRQQRARDRAQIFQEGLRERLKADGKLKVHQDVIDGIVRNYQRT